MGVKVKVSVTIDRRLLGEAERLAGTRSRSEVFERALGAWVHGQARAALDDAVEAYYRARSEAERREDEQWATIGDDRLRKSAGE